VVLAARASINSTIRAMVVNSSIKVKIKATTRATLVLMVAVVLREAASNKETTEVTSKETRASVLSTAVKDNTNKTVVAIKTPEEDAVAAALVALQVHP
jgi:hypothetical protein